MQGAGQGHDWLRSDRARPLCIAHRGASDYADDNSQEAFERAIRLGADWLEADVRTTSDGRLVIWHDPTTRQLDDTTRRVDRISWPELQARAASAGRRVMLFDELIGLAAQHRVGIYVDAKDRQAAFGAAESLRQQQFGAGIIASFDVDTLRELAGRGCDYPLSVLVPPAGDPLALARRARASIVHLCWARVAWGTRPPAPEASLLEELRAAGLAVVLWHQEDRAIIEQWRKLPILGICSNKPELLCSYRHATAPWKPQIMCEGGIGFIAPPQTLTSASVAFNAGYDYVRINTSLASNGEVVTIDPHSAARALAISCSLPIIDANAAEPEPGGAPDLWHAGTRLTLLDDLLALAASHERGLAIEVQPDSVAAVLASVSRHAAMPGSLFWSHLPGCVQQLREQAGDARIISQRRHHDSLDAALAAAAGQVLQFDRNADEPDCLDEVAHCADADVTALVRYGGTDDEEFQRIIAARPTIICVERPDLLRALL